MLCDVDGNTIVEGSFVEILKVESYWFKYEPKNTAEQLLAACRQPLEVDYLDEDSRLSLILPATKDKQGEWCTNSISMNANEVRVNFEDQEKNET